jgi:hypothetical protein
MQAALAMPAGPSSGSRLDSKVHAGIARLTASISPTSIGLAWMDWATQLALSPGKRLDLMILGCNHWLSLNCYCQSVALTPSTISIQECIVPPSFDKRFKACLRRAGKVQWGNCSYRPSQNGCTRVVGPTELRRDLIDEVLKPNRGAPT